jgi:large subunit ribosomal protein L29
MPARDFRGMSPEELRDKATDLREDLAKLQMKRYSRRLDKSSELRAAKKELARLLTVLGEKERASRKGAS